MRTYKIKTMWGNGFIEVNDSEIVTKSTTKVFEQFIDKEWILMMNYLNRWNGEFILITGDDECHG